MNRASAQATPSASSPSRTFLDVLSRIAIDPARKLTTRAWKQVRDADPAARAATLRSRCSDSPAGDDCRTRTA